jgi:F-type H+-transporting ATPase subunit b
LKNRIVFFLMLCLPALTTLAEEGGGEHASGGWLAPIWHVPMIAWQVVNIAIVVGLLVYLLRRPAPTFFNTRAKEIEDLLEKAMREKEEANARLKEVEAKMAHLSDEVAEIERSSKEAAEAERQKVLDEAEAAKERIRSDAAEEMDRKLKDARRELKAYAADLAVKMAREILADNISESDEARLQDRFMSTMEEQSHERGE